MATRKPKDDELLDDAHLERVISLLEPKEEGAKAITKKDACSILNIAYNTTRLGQLIDRYKDKKQRETKRRAELRGKPLTAEETAYIIGEYLEGISVEEISRSTYRSREKVAQALVEANVPVRPASYNYFRPELIPDDATRERFKVGEVVWSAQYDSAAAIETENTHPTWGFIYRVWLLSERWKQYANVPACELASLEHLRKLGVRV
jgi:hypothetical protein